MNRNADQIDWSSIAADILNGRFVYVRGRMCSKTIDIQRAIKQIVDNMLSGMYNVKYKVLVEPDPKFRRLYAIHFDQYLRRN